MENKGTLCWNCVHTLPGRSIHLPVKYDDRRDVFETIGEFCSWGCAKRHAMEMDTHRRGEIQSLLALMKLKTIGHYEPTHPSPKKIALKCFGGTMDINDFRNEKQHINIHWPSEKRYFPIIGESATPTSTHKITGKCVPMVSRKLHDIEASTTETNTLKLKRPKPLQRTESALENVLGIRRKEK